MRALVLCDTRAQADTSESRNSRLQLAEQVEKNGPDAYLDSMVPKLLGATTMRNRPDIATSARQMMAEMSVPGIASALRGMAARPDSVETAKTIHVPSMIMVGEEDTLTPPADAEVIHKIISGSELVRVPAAGHYSPLEQPEFVLKKLRMFLERLPTE